MPVRKSRDASELESTLWKEPGTPELFRAIEGVWRFAERTRPQRFPAGVYKHRSIEDAEALVEIWAQANFTRFQRERGRVHDDRIGT